MAVAAPLRPRTRRTICPTCWGPKLAGSRVCRECLDRATYPIDDCPLTARQLEVVRLAMRGLTYAAIAAQLHLSAATVSSHIHDSYVALGMASERRGRGLLFATMLARGWARDDPPAEGYTGAPYGTTDQTHKRALWLPSPAERLYLDAFDELLRTRDESAGRDTLIYHGLMWHVRRAGARPDRGRDVDVLLRSVGAVICTAEQKRLLRYF